MRRQERSTALTTSLWSRLQQLQPHDADRADSVSAMETTRPLDLSALRSVPPRIVVPRAGAAPDRAVMRRIVAAASDELTALLRERAGERETPMPHGEQEIRGLGRDIIARLVEDEIRTEINDGEQTVTGDQREALAKSVEDYMFGLGPIQSLVDEPEVTDIVINGSHVRVLFPDGRFEARPPIADSDQEIIEWLVTVAQRAPGGGRPFSPVSPHLRLDLPGHIRLSAMAWTVPHPNIAIRLHRLTNVCLDDLVHRRMLPQPLARLLSAAANGGVSQVVSGPMGAGKTTLLRALANALPVETRIGTAETERELYLDELPGRAPYVVSGETITGGGERNDLTGELRGAIGLTDLLYAFVRMQLEVVIVGEVAGKEILSMFKAMQFTPSSMSSVHATDARAAIHRLATIAREVPGITVEYATAQVAHHIDLIVQLERRTLRDARGEIVGMRRFVREVIYVEPGESDLSPAVTTVYLGNTDGTGRFGSVPTALRTALLEGGMREHEIPVSTLDFSEAL
ncbi:CpaF family protein [Nocardia terpenica]|uniref:CpaF family protein n=1 Tax=Nocardia terpenica TaxID=455432 RepID=UPI0002E56CC3|nr:ATPase, T2SS/T4P/T4SS family [Nocardia terpenica]NQE90225.1 CpaF family protein [Nocardia terpenica]